MAPKKSSVWKYFTICPGPDEHMAECSLCDEYSIQRRFSRGKTSSNYSTKPLWNHLQSKHPQAFIELQKAAQNNIPVPAISTSWSLVPQSQPAWEPCNTRYLHEPDAIAHQSHQLSWEPNDVKYSHELSAAPPQSQHLAWESSEKKYVHDLNATARQSLQHAWEPSEKKYLHDSDATALSPFISE